jgi:high-affinity iron transporter
LTGMLGIQPRPTLVEALGWLALVVVGLPFVLWPQRSTSKRRPSQTATASGHA